ALRQPPGGPRPRRGHQPPPGGTPARQQDPGNLEAGDVGKLHIQRPPARAKPPRRADPARPISRLGDHVVARRAEHLPRPRPEPGVVVHDQHAGRHVTNRDTNRVGRESVPAPTRNPVPAPTCKPGPAPMNNPRRRPSVLSRQNGPQAKEVAAMITDHVRTGTPPGAALPVAPLRGHRSLGRAGQVIVWLLLIGLAAAAAYVLL